ncbi:hypothetical protein OQJ05_10920 [Fluoribacter gormanii]|uniref:hypothetical protein n=1 Tax=Fluoribacter gormanii TaxID=464 RepID=UPI002243468A|nr:hypothetical protein [Fluoribacter gormanii]MCW8444564.1 hypothetical protein [Fluoribacter gormanii]
MLHKDDAVALFIKYETALLELMRTMRFNPNYEVEKWLDENEMYAVFPELYRALYCLKNNGEATYDGVHRNSFDDKPFRKIFGTSKDPLQIIQDFVEYYSKEHFAAILLDYLCHFSFDTDSIENLNRFYSELNDLCTPRPIAIYRSDDGLALKFPSNTSYDYFKQMIRVPVGVFPSFRPVLHIKDEVVNGQLVATFPNRVSREEAINLLGLTGAIITRQGDNQIVFKDPTIVQYGQSIYIDTPEHLSKPEKKWAYLDYRIIVKGLSAYAKSPNSFFSNFPAEINMKITSTVADVCDVELESNAACRLASTYLG